MSIKIIDLFSGPGGLGEGFSAYENSSGVSPFKIALSIEKESSAHQTLTLRAFYRQFEKGYAPDEYYDYLAGFLGKYPDDDLFKTIHLRKEVEKAKEEAQNLTLGENNTTINRKIEAALGNRPGHWVLIGGPPCQAYSLAGRSRNKGIKGYKAEDDHRNFLYREYLKVISRFRPSVFVMENVKGMLSANVGGEAIFPQIMKDLKCPQKALRSNDQTTEYEVFPLVETDEPDLFDHENLKPSDYIIRAEKFGIPQARHRVILLGIRKNLLNRWSPDLVLEESKDPVFTRHAINDLPKLRSGLSSRPHKPDDGTQKWIDAICKGSDRILKQVRKQDMSDVADTMELAIEKIAYSKLSRGQNWDTSSKNEYAAKLTDELADWYSDPSRRIICTNHESRSHIADDLHRYLFSASYTATRSKANKPCSPKTHDFPQSLTADHANWDSGHFADRFRTQAGSNWATTVTSHISKDGHYYIHYDPAQCRSFTVREAARIQTFPDNYFFVGNRTQQYVQVGNAVPPYLAKQIADLVYTIVS